MADKPKQLSDFIPRELMPDMAELATKFSKLIAREHNTKGDTSVAVGEDAWKRLETILVEYIQNLIDWDGFLGTYIRVGPNNDKRPEGRLFQASSSGS